MKTNIVDNFLIKASHDLGTAELIFKNKPEFTDTITFPNVKIKSNHDLIFITHRTQKFQIMLFVKKSRILGNANKSIESVACDSSAAGERKRWEDKPTVRCKPHPQLLERWTLTLSKVSVLIEKCSELDSEFKSFSKDLVVDVNDIGMSVRYDDIKNDPKEEEAFRYLEFTREIYSFVKQKLNK